MAITSITYLDNIGGIPFFPKYNSMILPRVNGKEFRFETTIRVLKNEVWYDVAVKQDWLIGKGNSLSDEAILLEKTKLFIYHVWLYSTMYIVDEKRFDPSPMQLSEKERLIEMDPTLQHLKK